MRRNLAGEAALGPNSDSPPPPIQQPRQSRRAACPSNNNIALLRFWPLAEVLGRRRSVPCYLEYPKATGAPLTASTKIGVSIKAAIYCFRINERILAALAGRWCRGRGSRCPGRFEGIAIFERKRAVDNEQDVVGTQAFQRLVQCGDQRLALRGLARYPDDVNVVFNSVPGDFIEKNDVLPRESGSTGAHNNSSYDAYPSVVASWV